MESEVEEPICGKCGCPIDDCKCPYCGETGACKCCIGSDKATGGTNSSGEISAENASDF